MANKNPWRRRPENLQCKLFKRKSPRVVFQRAIATQVASDKRIRRPVQAIDCDFSRNISRGDRIISQTTYLMPIYLLGASTEFDVSLSSYPLVSWRNMLFLSPLSGILTFSGNIRIGETESSPPSLLSLSLPLALQALFSPTRPPLAQSTDTFNYALRFTAAAAAAPHRCPIIAVRTFAAR